MSWEVELIEDGQVCEVPEHEEGATYAMGGTQEAWMTITYNYSKALAAALEQGFPSFIVSAPAGELVPALEYAVRRLGTETDPDYFKATEGNVGHALDILLGWARLHPNARFTIS